MDLWAAIDPWLTAAQDAKKVRCLALLAEQQQQADDLLAARFITQPLTIGVAVEKGVQT